MILTIMSHLFFISQIRCQEYMGSTQDQRKSLPWTMFNILTVDRSDISLQWPTTTCKTIADHGSPRQQWPPSAPNETLRPASTSLLDWGRPPPSKQIYFGVGWGGCMVLKTIQCCVDASFLEQKRAVGEIHPLNPQQGCIRWRGGGGVVAHQSNALARGAMLHVGH